MSRKYEKLKVISKKYYKQFINWIYLYSCKRTKTNVKTCHSQNIFPNKSKRKVIAELTNCLKQIFNLFSVVNSLKNCCNGSESFGKL